MHLPVNSFLSVLLINLLRYFLITVGVFLLFRGMFSKYKIQKKFVDRTVIFKEVVYSISGIIVLSATTYFTLNYDFFFKPKLYFNYNDYSYLYHILAFIFFLFYQDFYFYCVHRLLHSDFFYNKIHYIHHRFENPTAFTFLAQHPLDLFMQSFGYYIFIFIVPMHQFDLVLNSVLLTLINVYGHAGYEFFPKGFTKHWVLKYFTTATNHNMHHSHNRCNYGLWFTIWDRVFGTLHPDYDKYFESVKDNSA